MITKNSQTQEILKQKYFKNGQRFILKGIYFDEDKNRYMKINRPERLKYIKKTASRKFRKYKDYDMQFSNSSLYKKTYGVMWECW